MNFLDIFILIGILIFVLLGFRDGLLRKVFGLLAVLGGLICATKFMSPVADFISQWVNLGEETVVIVSFFFIFISVIVIVNLFYRWFGESGSDTLKIWSRLIGGFLGAGQGALAVSLVLLMFNLFDIPSDDAKKGSTLYQPIFQLAPGIFDYSLRWIPSSRKFFEEIKNDLEKYKSR